MSFYHPALAATLYFGYITSMDIEFLEASQRIRYVISLKSAFSIDPWNSKKHLLVLSRVWFQRNTRFLLSIHTS